MTPSPKLIEAMAVSITGAPFSSPASRKKAEHALQAAIATGEVVLVSEELRALMEAAVARLNAITPASFNPTGRANMARNRAEHAFMAAGHTYARSLTPRTAG